MRECTNQIGENIAVKNLSSKLFPNCIFNKIAEICEADGKFKFWFDESTCFKHLNIQVN